MVLSFLCVIAATDALTNYRYTNREGRDAFCATLAFNLIPLAAENERGSESFSALYKQYRLLDKKSPVQFQNFPRIEKRMGLPIFLRFI